MNSGNFEIDNEMLIEKIKAYPELYERSHKKYKNQKHKDHIWMGIAKSMNHPNPTHVKKKWSYLRDKFQRVYKKSQQLSGSGLHRGPCWELFDNLQFLKDNVRTASISENYARSTPTLDWNDGVAMTGESMLETDLEDFSLNTFLNNKSSSTDSRKIKEQDIAEILGIIKNNCENEGTKDPADYVDHFCNFIKCFIKDWPRTDKGEAISHITTYLFCNEQPNFVVSSCTLFF